MPGKNGVQQRTELHGAAAYVQTFHLEGDDVIVTGKIELTQRGGIFGHCFTPTAPAPSDAASYPQIAPRHQARIDFCA